MTMRLLLADQVMEMGHHVTTAKHGKEALELLEKRDFDLILLDVYMPELDGFGVLQILKNDPRWQQLPVLVISVLDEQDSMIRCIEMGADDFLHKPCDPDFAAGARQFLSRKETIQRSARTFAGATSSKLRRVAKV